ncbi:class II aldolase/adducin N-terminal [Thelonectria olida]|uniref:Class II aldolase/adducin N-terminal n=1 Tax=Thelonectria olida TaxID=1576542 RepID=A0A9P9AXQ0_9HYPO|nr:class II aldolase/adducin N-terminal [Thelonectria olida]
MLSSAPLRRLAAVSRQSARSFSHTRPQSRLIVPSLHFSQPLAKSQPTVTVQHSASFATSAEAVAPALEPTPASQQQQQDENQNFAAVATGGIPYPGIPKIEDPYKKRQWQLEHMAGAFRVFARLGFTEGAAGHISVRDPVDPDTFWINPMGVHFGMLKASDMVHIDENGKVIGGNRVAVNAAGFMIHSAIHKARPDVHAACHAHSKYGKAWSTFGRPLDIINQDACMFWNNQSVYSSFGGVVLAAEEGERIAEALGPVNRTVVLQNHGLLTAGGTVDEAAYLFSLMERSCEVQLLVESAGLPKVPIHEEEAKFTYEVNADPETLYTEFQPDLRYEIWKSKGELTDGL